MQADPSQRGVLYMVWGHSHDKLLERSIASLNQYHPELPVHIHRIPGAEDQSGSAAMFLAKAAMASISPFESTVYLDADTVVMGKLDFGFEKAEQFGLACAICECPWARRYGGLTQMGDLIEYNTGVLFYTSKARSLFYLWEKLVRTVDSAVRYLDNGVEKVMEHNDQAAFARAVDMAGVNPFVLPLNWNFRPRWHRCFFGPIRIWHDVIPPSEDITRINTHYTENPQTIYFDVKLG